MENRSADSPPRSLAPTDRSVPDPADRKQRGRERCVGPPNMAEEDRADRLAKISDDNAKKIAPATRAATHAASS
eukprot:11163231-Lingulodinium_polyedra.AAC.1